MNQGCTQRIEVARRVDGATQLLGRHVPERADQRGAVGYSLQSTSGSEIHQRERPVAPAQDVRRLDVAVHDAAVMQVAEDLEHLTCDGSSLHFVDDMGLHAFGEGFPIQQLLRDIQPQRRTFALPKGFDQPRDLWMRDGAEQLGLALKGIELLCGRHQSEDELLQRDQPRWPFSAIRPPVRRLRQHTQHSIRSGSGGGSAGGAANAAQPSKTQRTGRGVSHQLMMTWETLGAAMWELRTTSRCGHQVCPFSRKSYFARERSRTCRSFTRFEPVATAVKSVSRLGTTVYHRLRARGLREPFTVPAASGSPAAAASPVDTGKCGRSPLPDAAPAFGARTRA